MIETKARISVWYEVYETENCTTLLSTDKLEHALFLAKDKDGLAVDVYVALLDENDNRIFKSDDVVYTARIYPNLVEYDYPQPEQIILTKEPKEYKVSKVELSQEIREQLIKWGCVEKDGVWVNDNIEVEFTNLLRVEFRVNGKPMQAYTGAEKILEVLKQQMEN